ncbi:conserved hypothetical protein [Burkholderia latens]
MQLAGRRGHQRRTEPRAHEAENRVRLPDVMQVVRQPPGAREHARDHVVEVLPLVRRIRDERLPVELVRSDPFVRGKRCALCDRDEHRLALHEPVLERMPRGALAHEARVEHARRKRIDLHGRHHFAQLDIDVRQRMRRMRKQHRNHPVCTDGREAERDAPRPAVRDTLRGLLRSCGKLENVPCIAQEALASRGQPHLPAAALEQCNAERMFEQLDLPAQRRLCHEEPLRRATEMQFLGHRDEAAQLVQFNHSIFGSINSLLMLDAYRSDSYTRFHLMRGPRRTQRPRPSCPSTSSSPSRFRTPSTPN